ncbi:MAG: methyltransferase domain-containing protein [Phenylobacterium sp.]|uniref:class I SAM-dependent methyltransferase n=1 Tax=Phenylobacterium sp. TaxID=1871053 RepID=UPI001B633EF0|nr:class I SAM-dependent methyltransferase [Phenylobacterium sp.]MBP7817832.1 methyltransferase domain-containing protein [Phenylobacterium sp.]
MSDEREILQPEDWAGEMGARWLAGIDDFEAMIAPVGAALLARAAYAEGDRVVDIGCGGGATSLAIASEVGPSGSVVGIDISPDLTAKATERAAEAGTLNAQFIYADAASYRPDAPFDRLFSRFGSMFFPDPYAAFAHLHGCLRPGGRIDLAVWGPPRDNPWMMEMMGVLRRHMEVPPVAPRTPGPFALEDVDYLTAILMDGGFTGLDVAPYTGLQPIGGPGASPADAVRFSVSSLAAGRLLEGAPTALRHRVEDDLLALFARHHRPDEGVMMTGKVWLVSANA